MAYNIDGKDQKILDLLKQHAEYTTRQIAKKTLLPVTTVHNRIQKLKKESIIKRFTIDVDYSKLDSKFLAYVLVSVNTQFLKEKKKTQYEMIEEIRRFSFVERANIVSGGIDLVVVMRVKDVEEFDRALLTKLQLVDGIENTQSLIVIHGD